MNYQLISRPGDMILGVQEQILVNRGISLEEVYHYMNTTDKDISHPLELGKEPLKRAVEILVEAILNETRTLVVVDADCDGYTSSAVLINYLYDAFPSFVNNNLEWYLHSGKQHGLSDCIDYAEQFGLVILPDASSNDYNYHKRLKDKNINIIVLDHHEAERISEDAIIINNQMSDYPNKDLSGVGITWQFCRYIDSLTEKNFANQYLDLVALGLKENVGLIYLFH